MMCLAELSEKPRSLTGDELVVVGAFSSVNAWFEAMDYW